MGMRALSRTTFLHYAAKQIETALADAALHRAAGAGLCTCSRELPCAAKSQLLRHVTHYGDRIDAITASPAAPHTRKPLPVALKGRGILSTALRGFLTS